MFFIPYGTIESTKRKSFPIINVSIVLVNIAVFIYQAYLIGTYGVPAFESFVTKYSFVPVDFFANPMQIGLLTAIFLHAGLLHLIGNMIYLLPFGDNVEDRFGHMKYLIFYVLCGMSASLIYALFNQTSAIPLVGASGAIAGVLGAYLALHPRKSTVKGFLWIIIVLLPIRLPALLFILSWFILQLFSTVASLGSEANAAGGVAFLAHVGGFVTGLLLAPLFARKREEPLSI